MLRPDNAPVHNTERVRENLASFGFRRTAHPPCSPRLAPCDFFLFGAMKRAFTGQHYAAIDDLLMSVEALPRGISADFWHAVFQEWMRRLQLCCESGGDYFE
jgi:transposase